MIRSWCRDAGSNDAESKRKQGGHFWSNEWMDKIAEVMKQVQDNPNLSYEEKRKILDDYRKAMSSVN